MNGQGRDEGGRAGEKIDRAITANETATEALEKAKSAHKRLDKIDKIIFWMGTTVVGTICAPVLPKSMPPHESRFSDHFLGDGVASQHRA